MQLTARRLNRATLARQSLLERAPLGVHDGVRSLAALQAQEPASPYLALWTRLADFDPADLDAAFAERTIVKASLMRITLHAVHADDYGPYRAAMLPSLRASRLHDRRFTASGSSSQDVDALLPDLAAFLDRPRRADEVAAFVAERSEHPVAWWALRTYAPLLRAATGGPWSFDARKPAYVAASPDDASAEQEEAVQHLLLRYLEAFGPATLRDFENFTMLRRSVTSRALAATSGEVAQIEGPDGATLLDVPGAPVPPEDASAPPRLLPMWDSVLLAYADRSRVIPPAYRPHVIRRNGDVLPALLVDGFVAGVWRPVRGGIEVTAFQRLDEATWEALAEEAASLAALLARRDPDVYGRYARWWNDLPSEEKRVVPAPGRGGGPGGRGRRT